MTILHHSVTSDARTSAGRASALQDISDSVSNPMAGNADSQIQKTRHYSGSDAVVGGADVRI